MNAPHDVAAARLTPLQHIAEMRRLDRTMPAPGAPNYNWLASAVHGKQQLHREALRVAYAQLRGWQVSSSLLSFTAFAAGRQRDTSRGPLFDVVWLDCPDSVRLLDHVDRWRIGRQIVAYTSQPYDFDAEGLACLLAWGGRHRLRVTVPTDFPSWHYPGHTTLVEIRRAAL